MDLNAAIKRHSEALAEIVADLFAMLGIVGEATVSRLPWPTYRAVLRVLRPAESALRRLIVVAARGLVVKPAASRAKPVAAVTKSRKGLPSRSPSFQLFDPHPRIMIPRLRRKPKGLRGRIHMFNADGELVTIWPPPQPTPKPASRAQPATDGMVSARRLIRRLEALEAALADVPRQAMRLARWRMRQEASPNPSFKTPLRRGHPPGHRKRKIHEVDELLSECDWLAFRATMHDTS